jgi:hypothetical protein
MLLQGMQHGSLLAQPQCALIRSRVTHVLHTVVILSESQRFVALSGSWFVLPDCWGIQFGPTQYDGAGFEPAMVGSSGHASLLLAWHQA